MKNFVRIFMTVVAGMMAFSCVTDTTDDLGVNLGKGQKTVISVSLDESRTHLGTLADEKYPMYWSAGDKISVNGVESEEAVISTGNAAVASFALNGVEKPFCIAYPAAPEGQVLFAENQTHTAGTFGDGVSTMYGYGEESPSVTLNHLTGILKIGITGSATLKYAQISTVDRTPIAGAFNLDFTKGVVTPTADAKSVINYSFGEESDAYGQLSSTPTYIHVAVPAGIYDELYVTLYDNANGVMYATVKAGDSKPLAAGTVREFSSNIAYAPNTDVYIVKDAGTLAGVKDNLTKKVVMVADVDMTGKDWSSIDGFAGSFYGNGYAIKGLTAPLFGTTTASVIKGVHLEDVAIIETKDATIGALARQITNTDAVVESCSASGSITVNGSSEAGLTDDPTYYTGGLVGYTTSTNTFTKLTNKIDITVNGESAYTGKYRIAGCVCWLNDGVISHSTNLGNITMNAASTSTLYLAGVVNNCLNISNCVNGADGDDEKGVVSFTNTTHSESVCLGGITDQTRNMTDCCNYGAINNNGGASYLYIGGVARSGSNVSTITNCYNYGEISCGGTCTATSYIGGIMYLCNDDTFENCHNCAKISLSEGATMKGEFYIGGLTGLVGSTDSTTPPTITFTDCSNSGDITIGGKIGRCYLGGLIGSILADKGGKDIAKLNGTQKAFNSGDILFTSDAVTSLDITDGEYMKTCNIGGICGRNAAGELKVECELENSGTITVNGTHYGHILVGGAVAYNGGGAIVTFDKKVTLNGDITLNANSGDDFAYVVGGVVGAHLTASTITVNKGLSSSALLNLNGNCNNSYVGGFIGDCTGNASINIDGGTVSNSGNITCNGERKANNYIGGIIGYRTNYSNPGVLVLTNKCRIINEGDILIQGGDKGIVWVGGFIGRNMAPVSPSSGSQSGQIVNTGNITFTATGTSIVAGGIVGANGKFFTAIPSVINTGDILCTGKVTSQTATTTNLGGFAGRSSAAISNGYIYCSVRGYYYEDDTNKENDWRTAYSNVGLLLGSVGYGEAATNCHIGGSCSISVVDEDSSLNLEELYDVKEHECAMYVCGERTEYTVKPVSFLKSETDIDWGDYGADVE